VFFVVLVGTINLVIDKGNDMLPFNTDNNRCTDAESNINNLKQDPVVIQDDGQETKGHIQEIDNKQCYSKSNNESLNNIKRERESLDAPSDEEYNNNKSDVSGFVTYNGNRMNGIRILFSGIDGQSQTYFITDAQGHFDGKLLKGGYWISINSDNNGTISNSKKCIYCDIMNVDVINNYETIDVKLSGFNLDVNLVDHTNKHNKNDYFIITCKNRSEDNKYKYYYHEKLNEIPKRIQINKLLADYEYVLRCKINRYKPITKIINSKDDISVQLELNYEYNLSIVIVNNNDDLIEMSIRFKSIDSKSTESLGVFKCKAGYNLFKVYSPIIGNGVLTGKCFNDDKYNFKKQTSIPDVGYNSVNIEI
jgi:hypothetical protein